MGELRAAVKRSTGTGHGGERRGKGKNQALFQGGGSLVMTNGSFCGKSGGGTGGTRVSKKKETPPKKKKNTKKKKKEKKKKKPALTEWGLS